MPRRRSRPIVRDHLRSRGDIRGRSARSTPRERPLGPEPAGNGRNSRARDRDVESEPGSGDSCHAPPDSPARDSGRAPTASLLAIRDVSVGRRAKRIRRRRASNGSCSSWNRGQLRGQSASAPDTSPTSASSLLRRQLGDRRPRRIGRPQGTGFPAKDRWPASNPPLSCANVARARESNEASRVTAPPRQLKFRRPRARPWIARRWPNAGRNRWAASGESCGTNEALSRGIPRWSSGTEPQARRNREQPPD